MKTSTLTIIKHALIGFIIGMVVAVVRLGGAKGGDLGAMVTTILGSVIGAMLVMGVIGYFKARKLPDDAAPVTPMSTGRKVTLYVSLGFLGLVIGGVALLPLLR